jgi:hypothetical protein
MENQVHAAAASLSYAIFAIILSTLDYIRTTFSVTYIAGVHYQTDDVEDEPKNERY